MSAHGSLVQDFCEGGTLAARIEEYQKVGCVALYGGYRHSKATFPTKSNMTFSQEQILEVSSLLMME